MSTAKSPSPPRLGGIDLLETGPFAAMRDGELFRTLRDEAPLFWNDEPGDEPGFWSLTRYADVEAVAKDPDTFCNSQGTQILSRRRGEGEGAPPQIHNMDEPRHNLMRRPLISSFAPRGVEVMADRVREVTTQLLDEALELGEFDFVKVIAVQEVSPAGLRSLAPTALTLASLEGLDAHANAVTRRLAVLDAPSADAATGVAS